MYTVFIVLVGKIKYVCYSVFVCSDYSIILQHTYVCTVCSKCNTEQNKGLSHYDEWRRSVPFIVVFYIEHTVQLVIWKQNIILRRNNIVLNVEFSFNFSNWGVLPIVCVCFFYLCVEFLENEAFFRKCV